MGNLGLFFGPQSIVFSTLSSNVLSSSSIYPQSKNKALKNSGRLSKISFRKFIVHKGEDMDYNQSSNSTSTKKNCLKIHN
ncbi:hypothetical protein DERP_009444 [Dermatophagoides pteronyssinus]|uniref:Uncharacterized protein n=1 Tax=Dermatophagoides pteronyssinus TaxID=6956 RepID=A0ABQ8IUG5_DERPT|nr:hypothetical protein DERP_009444 [Dermatophagoides pteronyssinus]